MIRTRGGRRRGFTLIEMLLVIALMALVLGIGIGMFSRLDLGDRVALALVQDALRSAHNFSVARSAPARVRIDAATGTIEAEGMLVIGTWHFEAHPPVGAFGLEGSAQGGHLVEDGFQGRALSFEGEASRSRAEIPVQDDPAWNLREGFSVRCALRAAKDRGGAVLALGETLGLETKADGGVQAWFSPEVDSERGVVSRGGRIPIEAPASTLVPDRWSAVEVVYDRRFLRIVVDGACAAEVQETAPVSKVETALVLSPSSSPFPGAMDNLSVSAVAARATSVLPKGARFAQGTPAEILFAPGGGLDRSAHREPAKFALELEDGRRVPVVVNLFGTVE